MGLALLLRSSALLHLYKQEHQPLYSDVGQSDTLSDRGGFSNKIIKAVRRYHVGLWSMAEEEAGLVERGP